MSSEAEALSRDHQNANSRAENTNSSPETPQEHQAKLRVIATSTSQTATTAAAAAASTPTSRPDSPPPPAKIKTLHDIQNDRRTGALLPLRSKSPTALGRSSSLRRVSSSTDGGGTSRLGGARRRAGRGLPSSVLKSEWTGDASLWQRGDERGKATKSRWSTLALAYASVGVIFGDIATSPIYTMQVTFENFDSGRWGGTLASPRQRQKNLSWQQAQQNPRHPPNEREVLGAISVILWALTLLFLIKYTLIVLRADDQGNGGTFALYSMLRRQGLSPPPSAAAEAAADAAQDGPTESGGGGRGDGGEVGGNAADVDKKRRTRSRGAAAAVDLSSDSAVSAGISTFARGPESRRSSAGGGGGRVSGGTRVSGCGGKGSLASSPRFDVEALGSPRSPTPTTLGRFLARRFSSFSSSVSSSVATRGAGANSLRVEEKGRGEDDDAVDWRQRLIEKQSVQTALKITVVVSVGAILGDGVLTPSMSVVSAVEGLGRPFPKMFAQGSNGVVGVASGILAALFLSQRFGTSGVSALFSPIAVAWCFALAGLGIYNLAIVPGETALRALSALSPHHATLFFVRHGAAEGWRSLGSLALCVTGAEALYADLGHFNRRSITLATTVLVYPSLILVYLGQAALLLDNPQAYSAPFWNSIPSHPAIYWPLFALTVSVSVVASQALISAAFSIVKQGQCGFMPRLKVVHTSKHHEGQIYIPTVNWTLAVLCLAVVVAFKSTYAIGDAYGIAVFAVMLLTTVLMTLVFLCVWKVHILIPISFFVVFFVVESAFWSSSLVKVAGNGWFAILLAAIWASLMFVFLAGDGAKKRALSSLSSPSLDGVLATRETEWGTLELLVATAAKKVSNSSSSEPASSSASVALRSTKNSMRSGGIVDGNEVDVELGAAVVASAAAAPAASAAANSTAATLHPPTALRAVARTPGVAIFYSDAVDATPPVLEHLVSRVPCLFDCNIFLTNRVVPVPEVPTAERLLARSLQQRVEGFFSVVARYGYLERVKQDEAFAAGVIEFVLRGLGRRICRAAWSDDAAREALGLPKKKFARAVSRDLGLEVDRGVDGVAPAAASLPPQHHHQQQGDRAVRLLWRALGFRGGGNGSPASSSSSSPSSSLFGVIEEGKEGEENEEEGEGEERRRQDDESDDEEEEDPRPTPVPHSVLSKRHPGVAAAVSECRVLERAARQGSIVFLVADPRPHLAPLGDGDGRTKSALSAFLRRTFVSIPYIFIVRVLQGDVVQSLGIPRESVLEVVLPYSV